MWEGRAHPDGRLWGNRSRTGVRGGKPAGFLSVVLTSSYSQTQCPPCHAQSSPAPGCYPVRSAAQGAEGTQLLRTQRKSLSAALGKPASAGPFKPAEEMEDVIVPL